MQVYGSGYDKLCIIHSYMQPHASIAFHIASRAAIGRLNTRYFMDFYKLSCGPSGLDDLLDNMLQCKRTFPPATTGHLIMHHASTDLKSATHDYSRKFLSHISTSQSFPCPPSSLSSQLCTLVWSYLLTFSSDFPLHTRFANRKPRL